MGSQFWGGFNCHDIQDVQGGCWALPGAWRRKRRFGGSLVLAKGQA
jgi:hypothetical protein